MSDTLSMHSSSTVIMANGPMQSMPPDPEANPSTNGMNHLDTHETIELHLDPSHLNLSTSSTESPPTDPPPPPPPNQPEPPQNSIETEPKQLSDLFEKMLPSVLSTTGGTGTAGASSSCSSSSSSDQQPPQKVLSLFEQLFQSTYQNLLNEKLDNLKSQKSELDEMKEKIMKLEQRNSELEKILNKSNTDNNNASTTSLTLNMSDATDGTKATNESEPKASTTNNIIFDSITSNSISSSTTNQSTNNNIIISNIFNNHHSSSQSSPRTSATGSGQPVQLLMNTPPKATTTTTTTTSAPPIPDINQGGFILTSNGNFVYVPPSVPTQAPMQPIQPIQPMQNLFSPTNLLQPQLILDPTKVSGTNPNSDLNGDINATSTPIAQPQHTYILSNGQLVPTFMPTTPVSVPKVAKNVKAKPVPTIAVNPKIELECSDASLNKKHRAIRPKPTGNSHVTTTTTHMKINTADETTNDMLAKAAAASLIHLSPNGSILMPKPAIRPVGAKIALAPLKPCPAPKGNLVKKSDSSTVLKNPNTIAAITAAQQAQLMQQQQQQPAQTIIQINPIAFQTANTTQAPIAFMQPPQPAPVSLAASNADHEAFMDPLKLLESLSKLNETGTTNGSNGDTLNTQFNFDCDSTKVASDDLAKVSIPAPKIEERTKTPEPMSMPSLEQFFAVEMPPPPTAPAPQTPAKKTKAIKSKAPKSDEMSVGAMLESIEAAVSSATKEADKETKIELEWNKNELNELFMSIPQSPAPAPPPKAKKSKVKVNESAKSGRNGVKEPARKNKKSLSSTSSSSASSSANSSRNDKTIDEANHVIQFDIGDIDAVLNQVEHAFDADTVKTDAINVSGTHVKIYSSNEESENDLSFENKKTITPKNNENEMAKGSHGGAKASGKAQKAKGRSKATKQASEGVSGPDEDLGTQLDMVTNKYKPEAEVSVRAPLKPDNQQIVARKRGRPPKSQPVAVSVAPVRPQAKIECNLSENDEVAPGGGAKKVAKSRGRPPKANKVSEEKSKANEKVEFLSDLSFENNKDERDDAESRGVAKETEHVTIASLSSPKRKRGKMNGDGHVETLGELVDEFMSKGDDAMNTIAGLSSNNDNNEMSDETESDEEDEEEDDGDENENDGDESDDSEESDDGDSERHTISTIAALTGNEKRKRGRKASGALVAKAQVSVKAKGAPKPRKAGKKSRKVSAKKKKKFKEASEPGEADAKKEAPQVEYAGLTRFETPFASMCALQMPGRGLGDDGVATEPKGIDLPDSHEHKELDDVAGDKHVPNDDFDPFMSHHHHHSHHHLNNDDHVTMNKEAVDECMDGPNVVLGNDEDGDDVLLKGDDDEMPPAPAPAPIDDYTPEDHHSPPPQQTNEIGMSYEDPTNNQVVKSMGEEPSMAQSHANDYQMAPMTMQATPSPQLIAHSNSKSNLMNQSYDSYSSAASSRNNSPMAPTSKNSHANQPIYKTTSTSDMAYEVQSIDDTKTPLSGHPLNNNHQSQFGTQMDPSPYWSSRSTPRPASSSSCTVHPPAPSYVSSSSSQSQLTHNNDDTQPASNSSSSSTAASSKSSSSKHRRPAPTVPTYEPYFNDPSDMYQQNSYQPSSSSNQNSYYAPNPLYSFPPAPPIYPPQFNLSQYAPPPPPLTSTQRTNSSSSSKPSKNSQSQNQAPTEPYPPTTSSSSSSLPRSNSSSLNMAPHMFNHLLDSSAPSFDAPPFSSFQPNDYSAPYANTSSQMAPQSKSKQPEAKSSSSTSKNSSKTKTKSNNSAANHSSSTQWFDGARSATEIQAFNQFLQNPAAPKGQSSAPKATPTYLESYGGAGVSNWGGQASARHAAHTQQFFGAPAPHYSAHQQYGQSQQAAQSFGAYGMHQGSASQSHHVTHHAAMAAHGSQNPQYGHAAMQQAASMQPSAAAQQNMFAHPAYPVPPMGMNVGMAMSMSSGMGINMFQTGSQFKWP